MEKKSGKPPKPLRLLVNLFNKTKGSKGNGGGSNKNDNAVTAERAKDRNDNGECISRKHSDAITGLLTQPVSQTSASPTQLNINSGINKCVFASP